MDLSTHRHTPGLIVIDPRGLPVRSVAFHRREAQHAAQAQVTRQCYDAAGRSTGQWDPRLFALWRDDDATLPNQSAIYALSGQALATDSVDAGWRVQLFGDGNQALSLWDSRLTRSRIEYDALLRPTAMFERANHEDTEQCRERLIYGGNTAEDHAYNRCRQLIQHDDSAGRQFMPSYSLTGQLLEQGRQFLTAMTPPQWPNAELEGQRFLTRWQYDVLGGALQQTDALGHQQHWRHDIAGQLMLSQVAWPETQPYTVLHRCVYDVSGQLLEQTAGNGVISRNTYESATGRLSRRSAHKADGTLLQDLHYRYDPVGNVVQIDDTSKPTRFFRNQRIDPTSTYTYDTLYQLIAATGREVASVTYGPGLPAALDANNLVNYREIYDYDSAGNLQQLQHMGGQSWTLRMATARHSNRSLEARDGELPGEPEIAAGFDENGNLRALQPGQTLTWNLRNQLQQVSPVERLNAANDSEHYLYDSGGQRVRKLRLSQAANIEHQADVRYLPGLEIRRNSAVAGGQILYVITAQGVRLLHWEHGLRADQWRYNLTDHLGSCTLELDEHAALLTEEGYTPFGSTAWWAAKSETDTRDKTVRYSGKERDATGLYYYGFRYYAPWLCRWVNTDPGEDVDGLNRYWFVRNSPVTSYDLSGLVHAGVNDSFERTTTRNFSIVSRGLEGIRQKHPDYAEHTVTAIQLAQLAVRETLGVIDNFENASRPKIADAFIFRTVLSGYSSETLSSLKSVYKGIDEHLTRISEDENMSALVFVKPALKFRDIFKAKKPGRTMALVYPSDPAQRVFIDKTIHRKAHVLASVTTLIHELSHHQGTFDIIYVDSATYRLGVNDSADKAASALTGDLFPAGDISEGGRDAEIYKNIVSIRAGVEQSLFNTQHPELMGDIDSLSSPGVREKALSINADSIAVLAISLSRKKIIEALKQG